MPRKKQSKPQPVAVQETPPLNPVQAGLKRILNGKRPANRQESFYWFRWNRLTQDQKQALADHWQLPGPKAKNTLLAKQAIQELG